MPTDQVTGPIRVRRTGVLVPLRDVASHGCGLTFTEQPLPIPAGQVVELSFKRPGRPCAVRRRVVWLNVTGRAAGGVEYVEYARTGRGSCIGLLNLDKVKIDPAWALEDASVAGPAPAGASVRRRRHGRVCGVSGAVRRCVASKPWRKSSAAAAGRAGRAGVAQADPRSRLWRSARQGTNRSSLVRSICARPRALQPDDVVALCDELMHAAILRQASDIHIDPEPDGVQVRFRVDGVLDTLSPLPAIVHNGIISRFKVLSGMDIAEKRAPQDGGFKHRFGRARQTIDIRVATLPTKYGERMTLRLLALQTESLTLERLGMLPSRPATFSAGHRPAARHDPAHRPDRQRQNDDALRRHSPVHGPREARTSSRSRTRSSMKSPASPRSKSTRPTRSRSSRRCAAYCGTIPDVVMIGEIRDAETADVAIKASLTGHLVLSTLHTNSAASVITRLADMGVDRYLVAATLRLAVAQRLVRQLCPRCRLPRDLTRAEAAAFQRPEVKGTDKQFGAGLTATSVHVHDPGKCIYCGGHGYIARLGLFEMLPVDDDLARLIADGADETRLLLEQRHKGFARLIDDGFEKATQGVTSIREVLGAVTVW